MKTRAVSMVLLMIASALAGCTSGDPDGDGELGIDSDVLNQMIEDNLQDFINNSSVTVHQTVHYHNNTTYVDNSESNTNLESSETGSSSVIQVIRIQDSAPYSLEDIGNNTFVMNGILQYPGIGIAPDLIYTVDSTTISLTLTCNEYVNARERMGDDNWRLWLNFEEGIEYSAASSLAYDIEDDIIQLQDEAQEYCGYSSYNYAKFTLNMLEIDISMGEAIQFESLSAEWKWNISCDDGYFSHGTGHPDYSYYSSDFLDRLFGGWDDCTFTIYQEFTQVAYWNSVRANSSNEILLSIPIWFDYAEDDWWDYLQSERGVIEHDSIVYFRKFFVVPVE